MAKGGPIASLLVSIGADTSGLESGGRRGAKAMQDLGKQAEKLGKQMAAVGAAAAAAGAAIVAGLVKSGMSAIDAQAKLARSMDGTIDGLRTLTLAAENAGLSAQEMEGNLLRMNRRLGEMARTGGGPAAAALNKLGLSAQDLLRLPLEQRVAVVSEEISKLGTGAEMASVAFGIFGDAGIKMVPLLKDGGAAIREAAEEVRAFGLSVSEVDAAKIEMANDAMSRIGRVVEAVRNQLAIAFAPLLKEIADRFNGLAKANGGFAQQARNAAEFTIRAFARVADVLHILRTAFAGLKTVAMGFSAAVWSSLEGVAKAIRGVVNRLIDGANMASRALSQLPGIELPQFEQWSGGEFFHVLESSAETAREMLRGVRNEFVSLAKAEWPSTAVEGFLQSIRDKADEAAQAMVAAQSGGGFAGGEDSGQAERLAAELERQREALQRRLDAVAEFMASERDLEVLRHEERLQTLQESLDQELITLEEYHIAAQMLEEGHAERMRQIREKNMTDLERFTNASFGRQVKTVTGHLADMTAGVARENKAMFEANKVAGIANAIVNAYEGISLTMSKYPYPLNIGMAAAHAAAAFAQVQAIRSQSFAAGGGAAPSLAGGTPATPVTPVTGGTPASAGGSGGVLTVEGVSADSLFSGRAVRELMDRIAEHVRDGGTVQFA